MVVTNNEPNESAKIAFGYGYSGESQISRVEREEFLSCLYRALPDGFGMANGKATKSTKKKRKIVTSDK